MYKASCSTQMRQQRCRAQHETLTRGFGVAVGRLRVTVVGTGGPADDRTTPQSRNNRIFSQDGTIIAVNVSGSGQRLANTQVPVG